MCTDSSSAARRFAPYTAHQASLMRAVRLDAMANGQVSLAVNLSRLESALKEFLQSSAHLEKYARFILKPLPRSKPASNLSRNPWIHKTSEPRAQAKSSGRQGINPSGRPVLGGSNTEKLFRSSPFTDASEGIHNISSQRLLEGSRLNRANAIGGMDGYKERSSPANG